MRAYPTHLEQNDPLLKNSGSPLPGKKRDPHVHQTNKQKEYIIHAHICSRTRVFSEL